MSYGQYGGMGYRNGEHVREASDALITPDNVNHGVPGGYGPPDLSVLANGNSGKAMNGHVVLGDGPIYVSLYKHIVMIYRLADGRFEELDLQTIGVNLPDEIEGVVIDLGDGRSMLNDDRLVERTDTLRFEVDGHVIEYRLIAHPRWVPHARLTQPDGTVWTGFCGMKIGVGFEDKDTDPIAKLHQSIFDGDDRDLMAIRRRLGRQRRRY